MSCGFSPARPLRCINTNFPVISRCDNEASGLVAMAYIWSTALEAFACSEAAITLSTLFTFKESHYLHGKSLKHSTKLFTSAHKCKVYDTLNSNELSSQTSSERAKAPQLLELSSPSELENEEIVGFYVHARAATLCVRKKMLRLAR